MANTTQFQPNTHNSSSDISRYLIVRPQNGGITDLFRFLVSADKASAAKFLEASDGDTFAAELLGGDDGGITPEHRWVIFVSIIVRKILSVFGKPMEWSGCLFEFFLNFLSENGGLLGLLCNLLQGNQCTILSIYFTQYPPSSVYPCEWFSCVKLLKYVVIFRV